MIPRGLDQRADIFREAGAAEARYRMQELRPDAVIEPDTARHLLHIGADALAQIGDFVDERDLGGEECIGCLFDEFGRAPLREQDRAPG